MAEKRMFSKKIIDTDWFMDMPASTQNLYFHLSMRADDDGFVASPKRIIKLIGATEDDYKILIAKKFVIPFESGVCVITDWRINNYLRNDRYTETIYKEERNSLVLDENGKYNIGIPNGIPQVDPVYISNSNTNSNTIIDSNIGGVGGKEKEVKQLLDNTQCLREKKQKHKYGEFKKVLLTDEELEKLNNEFGEAETQKAITYLDEYIEMKGAKYKSHYLVMKKWVYEAIKERAKPANNNNKSSSSKIPYNNSGYTDEELEEIESSGRMYGLCID